MDAITNFSKKLKELMTENGLNAESLGKILGVPPKSVRNWCLYERDIKITNLLKLANHFGCSLDYLCGRSDDFLNYIPKECPVFMEWLPIVIKECKKTSYLIFKKTVLKSPYFTRWRKGQVPRLSSLNTLAAFLECSLDRLVGRDR